MHLSHERICGGADHLIIEAIPERLALNCEILSELDTICHPDAILATKSSLRVGDRPRGEHGRPGRVIGLRSFNPASVIPLVEVVATRRPADVIGMHFFNPAAIMQLVEVVSKVARAPDADAIVWRSTLGSVSSRCAAEIGPGSL